MRKSSVLALVICLLPLCSFADIMVAAHDVVVGGPGNTGNVFLTVSGLGNFVSPHLGAFDLELTFDPSIIALNQVNFLDQLGDPPLGAVEGASMLNATTVELFEVSLLPDLSFQPDHFSLAYLTFTALAQGTSPLDVSLVALGDENGNPLSATVQNASFQVMPEPASLLLLGSCLGALTGAFLRRRLA